MSNLTQLTTRQGVFIGQLYNDHIGSSPGVTVHRNSRGYACGICRDGEAFIICGSRLTYSANPFANYVEYIMGGM